MNINKYVNSSSNRKAFCQVDSFMFMNNCSDLKWDQFYKKENRNLRFPDEDIVRLFLGPYLESLPKTGRLLDHGFGSGNNLVFFASLGYQCSGIEVSLEAIKAAEKLLFPLGFSDFDLKLFDGQSLPYPDKEFDVIVSWNSIHYNGYREKVLRVIDEFRRVLKLGGHLLMSTVAPESSIIKDRSTYLGNDSYILKGSEWDNRQDTVFFCLPRRQSWLKILDNFSDIKLGYQLTDLFIPNKIHAAYIIDCVRREE